MLLLKDFYVLANFLDYIRDLNTVPFLCTLKGNLDSANKFNNITSQWRQSTSLWQSSYAQKLELMSTLLCVIRGEASEALQPHPRTQEATTA